MLEKLRNRMAEEEGFTLVELLVVMLILGILAAIAIPSFFAQRDKATDAEAKANVKTAQTAIETYATQNSSGDYNQPGVPNGATLEAIEPTLEAAKMTVAATADTYTVTYQSDRGAGHEFSINRLANGNTTQTCTGDGGCSGNSW